MTRNMQPNATVGSRARFEAEDRATDYLAKFPSDVAFATALMVEFLLAKKWFAEYSEMMRRGDNREVFHISEDDFERMRVVRGLVPRDVVVDMIAMHDLRRLLTGLPADERWMAASTVAWRAAQLLQGARQKLDVALPELTTSAHAVQDR